MISCGIQWNPSHFIWKLVEYNDSISIFHWNPGGMEWNTMDSMWNTMIPWNVMDSIPFHVEYNGFHSIPPGFQWNIHMEFQYSIAIPYRMNVEKCTKMSGTSAKFIPYGIDTNSI